MQDIVMNDAEFANITLGTSYYFADILPPSIINKTNIRTCEGIPANKRFTIAWDLYCVGYLTGNILPSNTECKMYLLDGTKTLVDRLKELTCVEELPPDLFRLYPLFEYSSDNVLHVQCSDTTPILNAYIREAVYATSNEANTHHYLAYLLDILIQKDWEYTLPKIDCQIISYGPGFYIVLADTPPNIDGFDVKEVNGIDCTDWFIEAFWSGL